MTKPWRRRRQKMAAQWLLKGAAAENRPSESGKPKETLGIERIGEGVAGWLKEKMAGSAEKRLEEKRRKSSYAAALLTWRCTLYTAGIGVQSSVNREEMPAYISIRAKRNIESGERKRREEEMKVISLRRKSLANMKGGWQCLWLKAMKKIKWLKRNSAYPVTKWYVIA